MSILYSITIELAPRGDHYGLGFEIEDIKGSIDPKMEDFVLGGQLLNKRRLCISKKMTSASSFAGQGLLVCKASIRDTTIIAPTWSLILELGYPYPSSHRTPQAN